MSDSTVNVYNATATSSLVLVCEHASAFIPDKFTQLGLSNDARDSHIAWDPGASAVAHYLADSLNAVLVESTVSRLIYDCNRPPESPGAFPARSEIHNIPGNVGLTAAERKARVDDYYRPFESTLKQIMSERGPSAVLITIHSFTPVYNGDKRSLEIGVLHDSDTRLADAILQQPSELNIQRNQPYGPEDGVTHTLVLHGVNNGLLNVMLEIRNDLIADAHSQKSMGLVVHRWLSDALLLLQHADHSTRDSSS